MANEAERVVVELLAKVDGFDGKVKQSAAAFGGAMKRIESSATSAETKVAGSAKRQADEVEKQTSRETKARERAARDAERQAEKKARADENAARRSQEAARKANAAIQQSSRQLGFQFSDIGTQLSSGTSPFIVLAQQGPQVANALEGAKGKLGQFATFIGGPWGAALFGAVTLLGVFGSKLLETGDDVGKLTDDLIDNEHKTQDAEKAQGLFAVTIEGVTKALRDNRKALDELAGAQDTSAEAALKEAQAQAILADVLLTGLRARLEIAKANAQAVANPFVSAGQEALAPGAATAAQQIARDRLNQINADLAAANEQSAEARRQIIDAQSLVRVERGVATEEERITRTYDKRIEDARKLAVTQGKVGDELERQVKALKDARDAEIERLRAARKTSSDTGDRTSFISPVTGPVSSGFGVNRGSHNHAGIDIAVPVGTPVKAPAGGVIIEAGTVPGYGNVVYIDHGRGTISRLAHLSQITAAKGQVVTQGQVIGLSGGARGAEGSGNSRGPHLHQEVRVNGRAVDPRKGPFNTDPAHSAEVAERLADEETRRRQAFVNELASAQDSEIDARQALIASAEEIAKLETDAIEISRKRYDDNLTALVDQGKLHKDEADQLRAINNERAKLRTELVARREDQRKFRMQEADAARKLQFQSDQFDVESDLLHSQEGIARTAQQRHDLEKRLIDLAFDEEKLQLEAIVAKSDRLKIELDRLKTQRALSDEEKAELDHAQRNADTARARLGTLGERKANANTSNDRQNASPLQQFFQDVPQTADEVNAALEGIAAGGLSDLVDGLADAIVHFKSLGDVARSILQMMAVEIVKVAIKMLLLKTLEAIGGFSGGGSVGSLGHESVHALGGRVGYARGGYPTGGLIVGPGTETSDSITAAGPRGRIRVSNGEYIIRGAAVRKLGLATLNQINATGALPMRYAGGGLLGMLTPMNVPAAAGHARGVTVHAPMYVDARGAVMNDRFARDILAESKAYTNKVGLGVYNRSLKDAPAAVEKHNRYGR